MSLSIAIVGTGNVAFHLTKRLTEVGLPLKAIVTRRAETGRQFTQSIGGQLEVLTWDSILSFDVIILAVPDRAIPEALEQIHFGSESIILHTSGAQSIQLLESQTNYGVLYPLQTFTKGKAISWNEVPILIEGNSQETTIKIRHLAESLSPKIMEASSHKRIKVHLAAVLACNFTNQLYHLATSQLAETGLELSDFKHLMQETLDKALEIGPKLAQTGPAARGDMKVMKKHLGLLEGERNLQAVYELMSQLIAESQT